MPGLEPPPSGEPTSTADADAVTPRWGGVDLFVGFLVAQILSVVGFAVYAAVEGLSTTDIDIDEIPLSHMALLQIPLWIGLGIVPLVATRIRGNGAVRDLGARMVASDAPVGLFVGVLCQLVLVPVVSLPLLMLTDTDMEELSAPAESLADRATGWGVAVLVLVVVVAAPLAEELFYRGMMQRTFERHLRWGMAALITSVLFGLSHFQLLQLPALVAFGFVLSYLARRSGRLGMSVWAHVGFNATTVVVLLALR